MSTATIPKYRLVTIDANIGSGKTTLLSWLAKHKGVHIDLEPVDNWSVYLYEMYHNNQGVFEFQVRVLLDRCFPLSKLADLPDVVKKADDDKPIDYLIERSPLFQKKVFIPINHELGKLSQREAGNLQELYDHTLSSWKPSIYIYLRSSPEKCAQRILTRGRPTEDCITLSYLRRLHELHESTYDSIDGEEQRKHVIDIEGKTVAQIGEEVWLLLNH